MPYTPKTYTNQVTAADLSRAETGIQTAQAGVDLAAPQSALDVVESGRGARTWVTATAYPQFTILTDGTATYRVLVTGYTSGASIAADVTANKLALLPGGGSSSGAVTDGSYNVKDTTWGPGVPYDHGAIADGASHPLSGFFATLAAAQVVYPHATALTDELDWAACQKAQDACGAAYNTGGRTHHPRGSYVMGLHTYTARDGVLNTGDGILGTRLIWATDLGTGFVAVAGEGGGQQFAPHFENMNFLGPRQNFIPTKGVRDCQMNGIQAKRWVSMTDCFISGFGANIVITGDHQKFARVRSIRGYYNLLFDDGGTSYADQAFTSCSFDLAAFASVACAGSNMLDRVRFDSTHVGLAPYAFYKFDGAAASVRGFLINCVLNCEFEDIGNACILDESTGTGQGLNSMLGTQIECPGAEWDPAWKIAARARDYGVHLRSGDANSKIICGSTGGFIPGDIAAYHVPGGGLTVEGTTGYANLFSPGSNVAGGGLKVVTPSAVGRTYIAGAAIAAGDIVEMSSSGYQARKFAATGPVLGVAAAAAAAVNDRVLVWIMGDCTVTSEVVDQGGRWIVPLGGGVLHRARKLDSFGSFNGFTQDDATIKGGWWYPAFAISRTGGGLAGGANLPVTLLGPGGRFDPAFIRPQKVTALPAASSAYRGIELRVEGGVGVADLRYVCEKNASDVYVWRAI